MAESATMQTNVLKDTLPTQKSIFPQLTMSSSLDIPSLSSKFESVEITQTAIATGLFKPLDPLKLEIRLLQISPPNEGSRDIYCTQETVSLDPFLFYRALSYEWGVPDDGSPDERVFVNEYEVKTTPNLRLALRHLKYGAWYWIDALCINQDDPNERGHQVGMMTRIFEQAFAIDAWLGPHTADSRLAMELIHELDGLDDLITAGSLRSNLSFQEKFGKGIKWVKPKLMDPAYGTRWTALQLIMLRSYWTRLWIIQEIVVTPCAERVQLLCGDSQALFNNLHTLIELIYAVSYSIPAFAQTGSWAALVQKIKLAGTRVMTLCDHATGWQAMKMGEGNRYDTDLLRLLTDYRSQLCSDKRDKVYALLGVSMQYRQHELPISYSISVDEVYKNTAKYVMQGSGELDVLLYCRRRGALKLSNSLPSWVPDWRCYDPLYRVIRDKMKGWRASGDLFATTSISADGNLLSTRAYMLGKVGNLKPRCNIPRDELTSKEGIENGKLYIRQCLDYFIQALGGEAIEAGPPTQSVLMSFYGTIISTNYRRKTCDSLWSFDNFHALCNSLYTPLSEDETDTADWIRSNIPDLLKSLIHRGLCQINLLGSQPAAEQGVQQPNSVVPLSQSTAGLCALSTRLDDDIVVVRGCPHPLVLRKKGEHYKLVDEVYVSGFMKGEAVSRFPEVDISLI